tara:strand:- start:735 stop:3425 length:2691 start_codon:yes stop_codon:yes gene_type:complete
MVQVLPSDETFARPNWILPIAGTAAYPPYYWWYIGYKCDLILLDDPAAAADWSSYPYAVGGGMQAMDGAPLLLKPRADSACALPVVNVGTDSSGSGHQYGVLLREETSFSHDDQDITITFGLDQGGGASEGFSNSGTNGSSPTPGGQLVFPPSPSTSGHNFSTMSKSDRGNWTSGGAAYSAGTDDADLNPWYVWPGNGLFFRCGSGEPLYTDAFTSDTIRTATYQAVDCYQFVAYPTAAKHLRLELWRIHHTNNGGTSANYARMLIRQEVSNGVRNINFRKPFHLRVQVENVGANVGINCFIGQYTKTGGVLEDEVQCFKDGALDDLNVYTLGPMGGVALSSTTGAVLDSLAAATDPLTHRITAFAQKTIGFSMPGTFQVEISTWSGASEPEYWIGNMGLYSIESKSIPASGAATVRYRDEFDRVVEAGLDPSTTSIVMPVVSWLGIEGIQLQGMFTWDEYSNQTPATLMPAPNPNYAMVRRLLTWPHNGYAILDYDAISGTPTVADLNRPYDVMKSFVWMAPSSQFYNHHRKIEFMPGPQYAAVSQIKYEFGILLRGEFNGNNHNGLICYIEWWTDGTVAAAITYAEITLAYRNNSYTTTNPADAATTNIVARKKYPLGTASPDPFPDLHDGGWHSLDAMAVAYESAVSPESAGIYTVQMDGVAIEFDDPTVPYQSAATTPFSVAEPLPRVFNGRSEGFYLLAHVPEYGVTGQAWSGMQIKNWSELALVTDPGDQIGSDLQESIPVTSGEGTPAGELNTDIGALSIPGKGVWDVNATVQMTDIFPIRSMAFDSGHTYGSPVNSKHRRNWRVQVVGMDMDVYQALQDFFNSHNGMQVPFTFVVPITNDGTAFGSTAGTTETVYAWFVEDYLEVAEVAHQQYVASFTIEELLLRNTV